MQNHNSILLIWAYRSFHGLGCTTITANAAEAER